MTDALRSTLCRWALLLLSVLLSALSAWALADREAGDRAVVRGDYREAVAAYGAALDAAPEDVRILTLLARAQSLLAATLEDPEAERTFAEAERSARTALALDPEEAEAHFELARALGELARRRGVLASLDLAGEIRAAFERSLELDPDHHDAMHALAMWHLQVPWILGGRRALVLPLFERAIELAPETVAHRVGFGEALLALGLSERAREQLELARTLPVVSAVDRADRARAEALLAEAF
jgi:tetratricopeptide (TPR) repeat protein